MSDTYKNQHVTFDKYETPAALHCIACNEVIGRRDEVPSKRDPRVMLHAMVRLAHYREVYVQLSDGSVAYLPFCVGCSKKPIEPEKAMAVVKQTWEAEMVHHGRPDAALKTLKKRTNDLRITVVGEASNAR